MANNKLVKLITRTAKELILPVNKSLAFGDYVDVVAPSVYRGGYSNGQFFFGGNGVDYRFMYNNHQSSLYAYQSCPPLAAVINRKAQCYINGITRVVNTQGKDSSSPQAAKIRKLLSKPNPLQTWRQFEAQQYIYIQLFGFCITLPIIPSGFEAAGPIEATSLWNIPPYMCAIEENQSRVPFFQPDIKSLINYVRFEWGGVSLNLNLDFLYIFTDFIPGSYSYILPDSRVKALAMPINNIIGSLQSRNELINYAGAQGIFSPDTADVAGSIPLKEDEKSQLQDDFKRMYGIQRGQWRYIISPAAIKWTAIGKPTKDLMLFEEIADDIMRICDAYNYPSPLLNSEKGPNVANVEAYRAQIYHDGILPESMDYYEQWNIFFKTQGQNISIIKDYDEIPALQEDRVAEGRALQYVTQALLTMWQQNLITANQFLDSAGLDQVPGFDVYYTDFVKDGKTFPSILPQPNTMNDQNAQNNETQIDKTGGQGQP